jgi:energy-converting hydrogenase B subunit D
MIGWLQTGVFLLVAIAGAGVVLTRDPLRQSIAVSFYGLTLALMFFLHQAPDVALSQIVVGAVALPLMIVLALAKVRQQEEERDRAEQRAGGKAPR